MRPKWIDDKEGVYAVRSIEVACLCGDIGLELLGEPLAQFYCHCDDCQAIHGAAYVGVTVFPVECVRVVKGEPVVWVHKSLPRQRCINCGTQMLAQVPGEGITGVKANLLPDGMFKPQCHIYCDYAVLPVRDALPHYSEEPVSADGAEGPRVYW